MAFNAIARIAELEREIRELEASLPAHSVPATMLIRLEELEEELASLRTQTVDPEAGSAETPYHE